MKTPKKSPRTARLNARVPERSRFLAELLCRERQKSLGALLEESIERLADDAGLLAPTESGAPLSDTLFTAGPGVRTMMLSALGPRWLQPEEWLFVAHVKTTEGAKGSPLTPEEIEDSYRKQFPEGFSILD